MVPVKIECGCGQHYAFDVEPVGGRMPYPIACPVCKADGTAAANEAIAQSLASASLATVSAAPVSGGTLALAAQPAVRVAPSRHSSAARISGPPPTDRAKAEQEARSKVCWGDSREDVIKFAMMQGIPHEEAVELVEALLHERAGMLRGIRTRKIFIGIPLLCVPIIAYLIFQHVGILPLKLFGLTIMVGLYGLYLLGKGCFMVFLPGWESGDIADK